jgi:hypothetical protein
MNTGPIVVSRSPYGEKVSIRSAVRLGSEVFALETKRNRVGHAFFEGFTNESHFVGSSSFSVSSIVKERELSDVEEWGTGWLKSPIVLLCGGGKKMKCAKKANNNHKKLFPSRLFFLAFFLVVLQDSTTIDGNIFSMKFRPPPELVVVAFGGFVVVLLLSCFV